MKVCISTRINEHIKDFISQISNTKDWTDSKTICKILEFFYTNWHHFEKDFK